MKRQPFLILISVVLTLYFFLPSNLDAIPAFARKYQISCQVCHSPAPRLKPFGEDYAGNGYRLTEYESPRYFIQAGDEKLSLLREVPLAIRIDGIGTYNFENSKQVDFGLLSGVKLLSGGELSDHLSYYFYFFMSEAGNIVGIEDAFLTYTDLFGSGINISAGQFQACDPFYKRELRLTLEDISILKASPGTSSASLTYDRGVFLDYEIPKLNTGIVVEVLNGSGIGGGGEELLFDKDKYKNILGYLKQPIGKNIAVGFMGYTGKELLFDAPNTYESNVTIFGPSLNLDFNQHLMINVQYLFRNDSRLYDETSMVIVEDLATKGGYLEAIYAPKGDMSKFYLTGLLNLVESDYDPLNYKSATLNLSYVLRRNVRLLTEFTWVDRDEKYGKVSCGFMAAF